MEIPLHGGFYSFLEGFPPKRPLLGAFLAGFEFLGSKGARMSGFFTFVKSGTKSTKGLPRVVLVDRATVVVLRSKLVILAKTATAGGIGDCAG